MHFNFRPKVLISTTLIAAVLFGGLIYIEDKAVNSVPKQKILVATKDIDQGSKLKESDFVSVDYNLVNVNNNDIKNVSDLRDKYVVEDIYKGEALNKQRIADKNDNSKIFLKKNEKEISIPVSKVNNDAFAGTLRKGDVIDITHTVSQSDNSDNNTEFDMKKAEVIGAVDSQGKFLGSNDKNVLASSIMVRGSQDDFIKISKDLSNGYFSIAKSSLK
ncbi:MULTISPECIES: Flp pilus assembly protein CpaB [Clostridium]|uniref:Flp pilus assembly protein CpaB n=1 Tax=Clostridium TaxID=1485 RepID=UPI000826F0B9|nr:MULTISPECIES: SAF domain-containing protein [Clostridium]PJI06578.1 hypothetical protein CUB90_01270 [Clostridium sp. CT7]